MLVLICYQNSADCLAKQSSKQYLHSIKPCPAPQTAPPVRNLGVHKQLGGDRGGIGDPTEQRDIPCHVESGSSIRATEKQKRWGFPDAICCPE